MHVCFKNMALLLTLFSGIAHGKSIKIATITSDTDDHLFSEFIFETEGPHGDITGLRQTQFVKAECREITKRLFDTTKCKPKQTISFNLKGHRPGNNLVVVKEGKYIVVQMRSPNFSPHNGGTLIIDVLYNGYHNPDENDLGAKLAEKINKSRRAHRFEIARGGPQGWQLEKDGVVVNSLYFESKKIMWVVVGVDKILVNK